MSAERIGWVACAAILIGIGAVAFQEFRRAEAPAASQEGAGEAGTSGEPELVPWDGKARAGNPSAPSHRQSPAKAENDGRVARIKEAVAKYKRDRKFRYVGLPALVLNSKKYKGNRIATVGTPHFINVNAPVPHFTIVDGHGAFASLPVNISGFSLREKKRLMQLTHANMALGVFGTLRKKENYYIKASGIEELGKFPYDSEGYTSISEILGHPLSRNKKDKESIRAQLKSAAHRLRRDRRYRYAEIADIILSPASYRGQRVAALGVPYNVKATESHSHFTLSDTWRTSNKIQVLMSDLPSASKELMFKAAFPPTVIALKAKMRRSAQGAYFLNAEHVEVVSRAKGSVSGLLADR